MEITGNVRKVFPTETIEGKEGRVFKKREFVVTAGINTKYPNHILFQVSEDRTSLLDKINEGDTIKVYFSIKGIEYTDKSGTAKYFVKLEAFRIDKIIYSDVSKDDGAVNLVDNEIGNTNESQLII